MSIREFAGQSWEFVGVDAVARRPGSAPDTTQGFPTRWWAFGPLRPETTRCVAYSCLAEFGGYEAQPLVSADIASLTGIPEQLHAGDATLAGRDLCWRDQTLDFGALYGGASLGAQAWAMAEFEVDKPTTVILGASADYWMQWWIDGREVLSTLADGNGTDPTGARPPAPGDFAVRHTFAPGKHLIVVRAISGCGAWQVKADFVGPEAELRGTRQYDHWEIHDGGALLLPPRALSTPDLAVRTDTCFVDETIECDVVLHDHHGMVGVVFGAQDAAHYYWAYHPRWGQNWRMRVFYLCVGKVEDTTNVTNLAMMRMPNVVCHVNARHHLKLERRGGQIRMWIDGVRGPSLADDTYGAGAVGIRGVGDYEVCNFSATGTAVDAEWQSGVVPAPTWYYPTDDTGYGTIRNHNNCLLKLSGGEILTAIRSHEGGFYDQDPNAQVQHYLSADGGRTWQEDGEPLSPSDLPPGTYVALEGNVVRLVATAPVDDAEVRHTFGAMRQVDDERPADTVKMNLPSSWRDNVAWASNNLKLVCYDSVDKGLTWSEPKDAEMRGDWRSLFGGPFRVLLVQVKRLRDGTLLALFLREFPNKLLKDFYAALPRPEKLGESTWPVGHRAGFCARSQDNGLSWEPPVPMDTANFVAGLPPESPLADFSEIAVGQLPTGRIVALTRTVRSPHNWQTWSDDGGRTWRQACYSTFSITGGPIMVATASGYLAVVGREIGLALHTSVDGGLNWDAGTVLDSDPWCNPCMIEAEPDILLVFSFAPNPDNRTPAVPKMFRIRMTADGPLPLSP